MASGERSHRITGQSGRMPQRDARVAGERDELLVVVTADERPDLWNEAETAFHDVWPEYNLHGDVSGQYFAALFARYAHLQVLVWNADTERIVARGRTVSFAWDGTLADLPLGIDALGLRALSQSGPP